MSEMSSRALLEKLIGFATVSRESNLAMIEFIRDYLAAQDVQCELFYNDERTKASLFATIGPRDRGGIALSGHTDVVPVDGQAWTVEPFRLVEKDGRLFGRGTADMKGFLASVLAAVPTFVERNLKMPVHLAFSYDEEVGCLGVRPMLEQLAQREHKPVLCLIGEPTLLKPVLGHKGKLAMRCCVKGAACHSAYAPYGVNAIQYAARMRRVLSITSTRSARTSRSRHTATNDSIRRTRLCRPVSSRAAVRSISCPPNASSTSKCVRCRASTPIRWRSDCAAMPRLNCCRKCAP